MRPFCPALTGCSVAASHVHRRILWCSEAHPRPHRSRLWMRGRSRWRRTSGWIVRSIFRAARRFASSLLNADKHPGMVTVELALIDNAGPPSRLGHVPINSLPDLAQDPVKPVEEDARVRYSILCCPHFDEFDVIFHRDRQRVDRSARISIQRFVLVPRQNSACRADQDLVGGDFRLGHRRRGSNFRYSLRSNAFIYRDGSKVRRY